MWSIPSRLGIACLTLASLAQVGPPREAPPAGAARVVVSVDRPRFFLGENVLVRFCVENTSANPFQINYGGDYRGSSRSQRFKMRVIDDKGALVPDPDPRGFNEGGLGGDPVIAPHGHWCESLPLMRYARIDAPGTYTMTVVHDLGWPAGAAPEGRTTVTLLRPSADQAERIAQEMLALPTRAKIRRFQEPIDPYQDFSTLRDPIYLEPLKRLIVAGHVEALAGLGAIPTPEATRALIDLLGHEDPAIARATAPVLSMRLPDPALDGTLPNRGPFSNDLEDPRRYLRDASWRQEFAAEVRTAAKRLLKFSDVQDIVQGAFMIEAVGQASDASSLSAALSVALDRTLSLPFETGTYPRPRGAMRELMRAAEVLLARGYVPLPAPVEPGDVALWLVSFGHSRPDSWVDPLRAALGHRIPYLRELALARLPEEAPAALLEFVGPALTSSDADLRIAGCEAARRFKLNQYHETIAGIARTAPPSEFPLMNTSSNALYALGHRVEFLEIMAARLVEEELWGTALQGLTSVFADVRGSHGGGELADLPAVSARWIAFIAAHRSELEAGKQFSLEDPTVTPDLLPRGYTLTRAGKPDWPPKR